MRALLSIPVLAAMLNCTPINVMPDAADDVALDQPVGVDAVDDNAIDTPADVPPTSCSLVGSWRGTIPGGAFAGQAITWTFEAGGTTSGMFGTAAVSGTWSAAGSTATLTDSSSTPAYVACPSSQRGTYTLAFSASCAMVTWHATGDVCDGRRLAVDTLSLARQ